MTIYTKIENRYENHLSSQSTARIRASFLSSKFLLSSITFFLPKTLNFCSISFLFSAHTLICVAFFPNSFQNHLVLRKGAAVLVLLGGMKGAAELTVIVLYEVNVVLLKYEVICVFLRRKRKIKKIALFPIC